ncbi:hypothetical protein [Saccharomonospora sp.]|uniref:hypothetical protein n=1 Tax=Saccharomonospora sp. TaxID=33913 RepID=UPI002622F844|nr:hypothetical protein [Saccharomonospora sp.]
MSDNKYPNLGFDPAPGNVSSVRDLAQQATDTGIYAREAHDVLVSIQGKKDVWTGEAAKAFADRIGDLPEYVENAHISLKNAGKALDTWADRLETHQKRAAELEEEARKAVEAAEKADAAAQEASAKANVSIAYDPGDPSSAEAARQELQSRADAAAEARGKADRAWGSVEEIRRQARNLQDTWEDDARKCAEALNRAAEHAPDKGMFEAIGDALSAAGEWVLGNLGPIGDVAGMISAVAGALSFIPCLAPITGPIALISGGVALAAHCGEMVAEGKWTDINAWGGLGTDVLGLVPGVGAATKGFSAATDTFQMVEGLGTAAGTGTRVFLQEAGTVAKPAEMFKWWGNRTSDLIGGDAGIIAKASQSTVNLGLQAPVAADLFIGNDTTEDVKNATGWVSGGAAGGSTVGTWGEGLDGIKGLGTSLSSFVKALG